jgi:hypothetical protein
MPHLLLISALLFTLLALVAIAIGAWVGIARDLMLEEAADETPEGEVTAADSGDIGLAEDFGIGLRHATDFAQDPGRSFRGSGSLNTRV